MKISAGPVEWNPSLYDKNHAFVFNFGEELVQLLNPKPMERILDLGCGTGYLTDRIAQAGASVVGLDNSVEMIQKAREHYPDIAFQLGSATDLQLKEQFDAVFSNAALHWITEKEKVIERLAEHLKVNGRLVLEMGGKGNVKSILDALKERLNKYGFAKLANVELWYFPTLGEYASLLESRGFVVTYAAFFDRPTELKDPANGIKDWLGMFANSVFSSMEPQTAELITGEIQESLRATNFIDGSWWADYKRLRMVAYKQAQRSAVQKNEVAGVQPLAN